MCHKPSPGLTKTHTNGASWLSSPAQKQHRDYIQQQHLNRHAWHLLQKELKVGSVVRVQIEPAVFYEWHAHHSGPGASLVRFYEERERKWAHLHLSKTLATFPIKKPEYVESFWKDLTLCGVLQEQVTYRNLRPPEQDLERSPRAKQPSEWEEHQIPRFTLLSLVFCYHRSYRDTCPMWAAKGYVFEAFYHQERVRVTVDLEQWAICMRLLVHLASCNLCDIVVSYLEPNNLTRTTHKSGVFFFLFIPLWKTKCFCVDANRGEEQTQKKEARTNMVTKRNVKRTVDEITALKERLRKNTRIRVEVAKRMRTENAAIRSQIKQIASIVYHPVYQLDVLPAPILEVVIEYSDVSLRIRTLFFDTCPFKTKIKHLSGTTFMVNSKKQTCHESSTAKAWQVCLNYSKKRDGLWGSTSMGSFSCMQGDNLFYVIQKKFTISFFATHPHKGARETNRETLCVSYE